MFLLLFWHGPHTRGVSHKDAQKTKHTKEFGHGGEQRETTFSEQRGWLERATMLVSLAAAALAVSSPVCTRNSSL